MANFPIKDRPARKRPTATIGAHFSEGDASAKLQPEAPYYSWSNIEVDTVLGEGGFCYVFKVSLANHKILNAGSISTGSGNTNLRHPRETKFFALKTLKSKPPKSKKSRRRGKVVHDAMTAAAMDLAMEAALLSMLEPHENIIGLYGISSLSLAEAQNKNGMGYFILLDILSETLRDRLNHWRRKLQQQYDEGGGKSRTPSDESVSWKSSSTLITTGSMLREALKQTKSTNQHLDTKEKMMERIQSIALQVARGMSYLHQHDIVLRDLKPDNVGFYYDAAQKREFVKLFDFGMARQLKTTPPKTTDKGHGTIISIRSRHTISSQRRFQGPAQPQFVGEVAGSFRYMPPETMRGEGTWLQSDVYSFGILLWEISTLSLPYDDDIKRVLNQCKTPRTLCMSNQEVLQKLVVKEEYRPSLTDHVCISNSSGLKRLLPQCWSPVVTRRPSFARIIKRLIEVTLEDRYPSAALGSVPKISRAVVHQVIGKKEELFFSRAKRVPSLSSSSSLARQYHNLLLAKAHSFLLRPKDTHEGHQDSSKHTTSTLGTASSHSAPGSIFDGPASVSSSSRSGSREAEGQHS